MKAKSILTAALLVCTASAGYAQKLNGAGATFPNPIYSKWFSEYSAQHPGVEINYQPIGSGGGIRQVTAGTVDFGATDGPMSNEQLASAKVKVQHIPTVLGAVVPIYNLPGINQELKFSPEVLADIYLGKITNWSDGRIEKDNPGVKLPNTEIIVTHRSDGSGTTFIFTDYLSKVSNDWKTGPGANTAVSWPKGLGGKGNEAIAGLVRQMPGSIGYVELIYALQNKIPYGAVKNASGKFVKASIEGVAASAAAVKMMPADYRVSITNQVGGDVYPISSFTWLLVPTQGLDPAKEKVLKDFLGWMLEHGESEASSLYYAPLPASVAAKVRTTVAQMK
ncbi:phosphate ABC transporter substrate-binding protein PstS [Acidipila sp. EB88]|uniref:phosphate ABC transporter substrate-binding protein PstS n=1 Tax=Acidipila sp. EB88 TaxID=2305226 RepID=UPI000F5F1BB1|nr:phosphate ABC transporter substrate-binding protein PstS [Acidipila sp. EB88]RRA49242.1 phosphate ABC transporter substrate-binding protein PstS [Acidipila sp. EB88]